MYALDTTAAREADTFGAYLTETGKYIGKFTRAEVLVSRNKGTHGIGFTFEADSKQTTRFDIWTMDKKNNHLSGFKAINAIMACMSLRNLSVAKGIVERKDWDTGQTNKVEAEVFPDLLNKPIGLVLQKTEYEKMRDGQKTGETGWRLELVCPFRAADEFTASEILDRKTKPEKLTSILSMLSDRPLKARSTQSAHSYDDANAQAQRASSSGFDDMDDDVPFRDPLSYRGLHLVL